MEGLLNEYGLSAWWPVTLLIAVPLVITGLLLRRHARRRALGLSQARASRRKIRDVQAGVVTLVGSWRVSPTGRGVVEEEGGEFRVLVDRDPAAPAIADGAQVLVVGCATHQEDDPRPTGYRGSSKAWVVDARGDGHFVSPSVDALERAQWSVRARGSVGAALFAAGLMVAVASCIIAWRAAHTDNVYEDANL
jgi:hypothetical protein